MNSIDQYIALSNEFGSLFADLLLEGRKECPELVSVASDIFDYYVQRSNSLICLVENGAYWDAHILIRPILESAIKLCFICYSEEQQQSIRLEEYFHHLPNINKLQQSEHAKKVLNVSPKNDRHAIKMKAVVLSFYEEEILRRKYTKKYRKQIKQKWSFSEMIKSIDGSAKESNLNNTFLALSQSYGISSHLIHADETGIGLIKDRNRREIDEKKLMDKEHAYWLLSIIVMVSMMCTVGLSKSLKIREHEAMELWDKFKDVDSERESISSELLEKWKGFYEDIEMP